MYQLRSGENMSWSIPGTTLPLNINTWTDQQFARVWIQVSFWQWDYKCVKMFCMTQDNIHVNYPLHSLEASHTNIAKIRKQPAFFHEIGFCDLVGMWPIKLYHQLCCKCQDVPSLTLLDQQGLLRLLALLCQYQGQQQKTGQRLHGSKGWNTTAHGSLIASEIQSQRLHSTVPLAESKPKLLRFLEYVFQLIERTQWHKSLFFMPLCLQPLQTNKRLSPPSSQLRSWRWDCCRRVHIGTCRVLNL